VRSLPAPARDVALLVARLLLGTVMFAHGYQKLMVDGLGRTTQGFESMSIPVAIFSAAFVTVVEVVGSVLVVLGALLGVVAACYLVVMVGAAVFVHAYHGIFVGNNGWELVGVIAALLLALAAAGSGRYGLDHAVQARQARTAPPAPPEPERRPAGQSDGVARVAAFTGTIPQVSTDVPAPPLPRRRAPKPSPSPHQEP
jgi:putative oxidoreductase